MGNDTSHYFGAYLEIKTTKVEMSVWFKGCKNNCDNRGHGPYCSTCGNPIETGYRSEFGYPHYIVGSIVDEKWEDVLAVITPPSLFKTGVILAKSNFPIIKGEDWLHIDCSYGWEDETKVFPTQDEIEAMKNALLIGASDIIKALNDSPYVISVEAKAGYVLNTEY